MLGTRTPCCRWPPISLLPLQKCKENAQAGKLNVTINNPSYCTGPAGSGTGSSPHSRAGDDSAKWSLALLRHPSEIFTLRINNHKRDQQKTTQAVLLLPYFHVLVVLWCNNHALCKWQRYECSHHRHIMMIACVVQPPPRPTYVLFMVVILIKWRAIPMHGEEIN